MNKYVSIYVPGDRSRREHRVIMEKYLGRKLETWEVVHHLDGNGKNNNIDNLKVMSRSEHAKLHFLNGDIGHKSYKRIKENRPTFISLPKNSSTGFLGVQELNYKEVTKYRAHIRIGKSGNHIGNFNHNETAAHYRDSATRFYMPQKSYLNFPDQQLLPPMSVEALRIIKKLNNH